MQIENKVAIITGGGTGVGRATALQLARGGCSVLINYSRSQDEAEQTAGEVEALGVKAIAYKADVSDDEACRKMVAEAQSALGRVDILVNSAGTTRFVAHNDLDKVNDEDWQRIMAVNVVGPFHCARAVKEPMLAVGGGEIVNVSSVAARLGTGSSIPYACSKAAVDNLTVALAQALAPKIRVNGVAPGFITGRWLQAGLGGAYDRIKSSFEKANPLKRVCDPEDVAECITSIITGSDLVSGQTLVCDGGMMIAKWNAAVGAE